MGFGLFGRNKEEDHLTANTRISCTERGRMKAKDYSTGRFEYEVLAVIADRGQPTIGEVAEDVNRPVEKVKDAIRRLRGLVIPLEDMSGVHV